MAGSPSPTLPLLIWESGDLHAFSSLEEAERGLEAVDVRNGIYKGFDAAGRPLHLEVRTEHARLLHILPVRRERVVIGLAHEQSARAELEEILSIFLTSAGEPRDAVARMTLQERVTKATLVSEKLR